MRQMKWYLALAAVVLLAALAIQAGVAPGRAAVLPAPNPIKDLQKQVAALQAQVDNQEIKITTLQRQVVALTLSPVWALAPLAQFVSVEDGVINNLKGPHVIFTGANLHVRSGSGATDDGGTCTGRGNLLVGYNKMIEGVTFNRNGSHNLIVGDIHSYNSYGGLVAGFANTISGQYSSVSGGEGNTASGPMSSVSGGSLNIASGPSSSVSGGETNFSGSYCSSITGGSNSRANGPFSSILGGSNNTSTEFGWNSVILGGVGKVADQDLETIPAIP